MMKRYLIHVSLPTFAALYYCFGKIWELPRVEDVVGIFAILTTLLWNSLVVRDLDSGYIYDGDMIVEEREDGSRLASLALGTDPDILFNKDRIVFKVVKEDSHI